MLWIRLRDDGELQALWMSRLQSDFNNRKMNVNVNNRKLTVITVTPAIIPNIIESSKLTWCVVRVHPSPGSDPSGGWWGPPVPGSVGTSPPRPPRWWPAGRPPSARRSAWWGPCPPLRWRRLAPGISDGLSYRPVRLRLVGLQIVEIKKRLSQLNL